MNRVRADWRWHLRGSGPAAGFQLAVASGVSASLFLATIRTVFRHLTDEQADSHVVNVAGRQRMLAQRIAREAYAFAAGDAPARERVEEVAAEFGRSLRGLLDGDPEEGLPECPAAAMPHLLAALEEWRSLAAAVSALPRTTNDGREAVEDMARRADRLADVAHEAVGVLDEAFSGRVRRLRRRIVLLGAGGSVLLGVTYAALLAHARDRAARAEAKVAEQERELRDLANRRRELVRHLLEVSENERRRAASDLHDGPAQELMAAAMLLDAFDPDTEGATEQVATAHGYLNLAVGEIRKLIASWRPPLLDDFGIAEALRRVLGPVAEAWGVVLEVDARGLGSRPDAQTEIALYRTAYEAVMNALRHSGSKRVTVSVSDDAEFPGRVVLTVVDEAEGFEPPDAGDPDTHLALGLFGMRERLELLGGRLDVNSQVGIGTRVVATVPRGRP